MLKKERRGVPPYLVGPTPPWPDSMYGDHPPKGQFLTSLSGPIFNAMWTWPNHQKSYWRRGGNTIFTKSPVSFWDQFSGPLWEPFRAGFFDGFRGLAAGTVLDSSLGGLKSRPRGLKSRPKRPEGPSESPQERPRRPQESFGRPRRAAREAQDPPKRPLQPPGRAQKLPKRLRMVFASVPRAHRAMDQPFQHTRPDPSGLKGGFRIVDFSLPAGSTPSRSRARGGGRPRGLDFRSLFW